MTLIPILGIAMRPREKLSRIAIVALGFMGLCLTSAGCAHRDPKIFTKTDISRYRREQEGVKVSVDPWTRDRDMHELFRHDPSQPVVALRLILVNDGSSAIHFSDTACKLTDETGAELPLVTQGELAERLFDDQAVLAGLISVAGGDYAKYVAGGVTMMAKDSSRRDELAARSYTMELLLLDPGKAFAGYVFFDDSSVGVLRHSKKGRLHLRITRMRRDNDQAPLAFDIPFYLDR